MIIKNIFEDFFRGPKKEIIVFKEEHYKTTERK